MGPDPNNMRRAYEWYAAASALGDEFSKTRIQELSLYAPLASSDLSASELKAFEQKCVSYSTIKGICWALSFPEMRAILASRGYKNPAPNEFTDEKGARIELNSDHVAFQCGVFNACDLSLRELASKIQNSGLVKGSMEYDEEIQSSVLLEGITSSSQSYCGRGLKGEKICVVESSNNLGAAMGVAPSLWVSMSKGLVNKEISFD